MLKVKCKKKKKIIQNYFNFYKKFVTDENEKYF